VILEPCNTDLHPVGWLYLFDSCSVYVLRQLIVGLE